MVGYLIALVVFWSLFVSHALDFVKNCLQVKARHNELYVGGQDVLWQVGREE
jgi:hypothetical protein